MYAEKLTKINHNSFDLESDDFQRCQILGYFLVKICHLDL